MQQRYANNSNHRDRHHAKNTLHNTLFALAKCMHSNVHPYFPLLAPKLTVNVSLYPLMKCYLQNTEYGIPSQYFDHIYA